MKNKSSTVIPTPEPKDDYIDAEYEEVEIEIGIPQKNNEVFTKTKETYHKLIINTIILLFSSMIIMVVLGFLFEFFSFWIEISEIIAMSFLITYFTWDNQVLEVSAQTGRNLKHIFTGNLTTYGTGFYFIYFWESKRGGEGIFSLKAQKENLVQDYPAQDGPVLIAELMFKYQPDINNLATFELQSSEVIKEGLMEQASSFLLSYIKSHPASVVRSQIEDLQSQVELKFGIKGGKRISDSNMEKEYGIVMNVASLSDLDYEPAYQLALTDRRVARMIQEEADKIFKNHGGKIEEDGISKEGSITREKAFDRAMVMYKRATETIIKGSKNVMADVS